MPMTAIFFSSPTTRAIFAVSMSFQPALPDVGYVLGVMARFPGDGDQVDGCNVNRTALQGQEHAVSRDFVAGDVKA